MKNLSGWQRIAVIVAVIWFALTLNGAQRQEYREYEHEANVARMNCVMVETNTRDGCQAEYDKTLSKYGPHWSEHLATATLSLLIFGVLIWLLIAAFRWIRAGFAKEKRPGL